jgi:hypothetical protein
MFLTILKAPPPPGKTPPIRCGAFINQREHCPVVSADWDASLQSLSIDAASGEALLAPGFVDYDGGSVGKIEAAA